MDNDLERLGRIISPNLSTARRRVTDTSGSYRWTRRTAASVRLALATGVSLVVIGGFAAIIGSAMMKGSPPSGATASALQSPSPTDSSAPTPASVPTANESAPTPTPVSSAAPVATTPTVTLTIADGGKTISVAIGTVITVDLNDPMPLTAPKSYDESLIQTLASSVRGQGSEYGRFRAIAVGTGGVWARGTACDGPEYHTSPPKTCDATLARWTVTIEIHP